MRLCHEKAGRRRLQVAGVLLTSLLAVAQAFAQPPTAGRGKSAWPPSLPAPKNAEGKPDISGAWAPNAIRQNVDMVGSGVEVPFQPWAEKLYHRHKDNISREDPEARCLPPGVPRMSTTPYPFRIIETPGLTLIVYEGGAHVSRQILTRMAVNTPKIPILPAWANLLGGRMAIRS
jgi:hypothetical protein